MELKDFVVNVGPNGTFRASGNYHTTIADVDTIFRNIGESNTKQITLFFHGGLVNEKNGIATSLKMANHFEKVGHWPICFVWETGIVETLKGNISKVADTEIFDKLVKVLVKKLSAKLGFDFADGREFWTNDSR